MEVLNMLMEMVQEWIYKISVYAQLLLDVVSDNSEFFDPIFEPIKKWVITANQLAALGAGIAVIGALIVVIIMGIASEADTSKSSQTVKYDPALDVAKHLIALDLIKKLDNEDKSKNKSNRNYFTD